MAKIKCLGLPLSKTTPEGKAGCRKIGWSLLSGMVTVAVLLSLLPSSAQAPPGAAGGSSGARAGGEAGASPGGEAGASAGGEAGATGSSAGSPGMPDSESFYLRQVKQAEKKGLKSSNYLGSLVDLGMHYNRQGRYADAQKSLAKALSIIDAGAMKPTPGSVEEKQPIVTTHSNGTVFAAINKPPSPYEDMMGQLLPALVDADLNSNHLREGETHVKRLIDLAKNNRIQRVPNLMFAYNQYSEILNKLHRTGEADHYKKEAAKINASIRGL